MLKRFGKPKTEAESAGLPAAASPAAASPVPSAPAPAPVGRGVPPTFRRDSLEWNSAPQAVDPWARNAEIKMKLHQQLLDMMNLSALEALSPEEARREVGQMLTELLSHESTPLTAVQRSQVSEEVLNEILGLGPIEPLVKDPSISDILVNTHSTVFIERNGKLELTPIRFKDDRHLLRIIDKIVSSVGRRVDESQPMVDARLQDGSRVNAIVPPLAVDGPLLSIRKFATVKPDVETLIELGSITREIAQFLEAIVRGRFNILISGGTGSGKTTLLNAISRFIGEDERILTIEDAAELQLQQPHVVRLETRPPNIEGVGEVTQRHLVKNSLRMRPDRIVLGEVRGGEAFDMLQAMNTGHEGSLTTIHANSCRDALMRLEQMVAMAGLDLPMRGVRSQIASAMDVIIQLERLSDGKRRVVSVHELTGMEGDVITSQEIFVFKRITVDQHRNVIGEFHSTGIRPRFVSTLETKGIHLNPDIFRTERSLT